MAHAERSPSPPREPLPNPLHDRYLRNREIDGTVPWRAWLRERYARYWYVLGCLFVDMVIAAAVLQGGPSPAQAWEDLVGIALVLALTALEIRGYRWIWPREDPEE